MTNGIKKGGHKAILQSLKLAPYPKAIVDNDFNYIAVSELWYKAYGLEGKEIIGKCHYDFFPEVLEHKEWMDVHQRALEGETLSRQIDKFERADGSVMYMEWFVAPWYTDDNEQKVGGVIMYTKDITEKVSFEEKIKQLNIDLENKIRERTKKLEEANQNLEAFSYSVSHDLRAPLRAISGFSNILKEEYADNLDGEGERLLGVIQQNAERMGTLISDILEFSRTGRKDTEPEIIDMNWLAEQVVSEVSADYQHKQVETKVDELPEIKGDLVMLRQLMENLISNAFKYSSSKPFISKAFGLISAPSLNLHSR